jgi:hypothetical protein
MPTADQNEPQQAASRDSVAVPIAAIATCEAWLRLVFWATREALGVVLLAALTAYAVASLAEGRLPSELVAHQTWEPLSL